MGQICLRAHAKINLTLDITGRRPDGYHLLRSVMQSISLADLITLRKSDGKIAVTTDNPLLPTDERNICWQAAAIFLKHIGKSQGVTVGIEKRIPIAAGLGGGSSNAAAVLVGLNELYGSALSLAKLQELGLQVGADIPFCLQGGTALVEGVGEQVTPLVMAPSDFNGAVLVLLKPEANISTGEIYRRFDPKNYGTSFTRDFMALWAGQSSLNSLSGACGNVLETVTSELVGEIEIWKERLLAQGALAAQMSGSGPTVFGIFAGEEEARQFCLRWQDGAELYLARPVQHGVLSR